MYLFLGDSTGEVEEAKGDGELRAKVLVGVLPHRQRARAIKTTRVTLDFYVAGVTHRDLEAARVLDVLAIEVDPQFGVTG